MEEGVESMIRVVDVPEGATAEDAERLLNAPYEDGFYLMQITAGSNACVQGTAYRAFYKRRTRE